MLSRKEHDIMLTHDWLIFYDGILAGVGASAVALFVLLALADRTSNH